MIRKLGTYILVFIGVTFFLANQDVMARKKGDIKIYDFKYEEFKFLKGAVTLDLPDQPRQEMTAYYYKVLMDQYSPWPSGPYEISVVDVSKYKGPMEDKYKNKLIIERFVRKEGLTIHRRAFWYGKTPIVFGLMTSTMPDTFPTPTERDDRIRKDDEIFEHIVESFRYRKEDGTYAKPEIVRQEEEVKDLR